MEARDRRLRALRRGEEGEKAAEEFLRALGWTIQARRFRTRGGEIDLVARDGDILVFVEVKTRAAGALDAGPGAVGMAKQRRLRRAAEIYLAVSGEAQRHCRFDLVTVEAKADGPVVRHIPGAFDAPAG